MTHPFITTVTPLRGIAALIVVVFHSNLAFVRMFPRDEAKFISNGWLWVDFFFILSGFIISYVYSDTFVQGLKSESYWKYVGARFARIYPLHLFTLIWSLVCSLAVLHYANNIHPFFRNIFNPEASLPSIFLIQSLHLYVTAPLNTPSWSLSTEWWVYLIFPLLVPIFASLKAHRKIVGFLMIGGFYVFIKFVVGPFGQPFPGSPNLNLVSDFGIIRCLAGFMMGMFIYQIFKTGDGSSLLKKSWCFTITFLVTLILLGSSVENLIFVLLLFPLIILTAAHNTTVIKSILDTPVLQHLGDWSFSIYMVHMPIIQTFVIFFMKENPRMYDTFPPQREINFTTGLFYCIILVALTLITAAITYRYVEVPARDYLNKLFKSKQPATAQVN